MMRKQMVCQSSCLSLTDGSVTLPSRSWASWISSLSTCLMLGIVSNLLQIRSSLRFICNELLFLSSNYSFVIIFYLGIWLILYDFIYWLKEHFSFLHENSSLKGLLSEALTVAFWQEVNLNFLFCESIFHLAFSLSSASISHPLRGHPFMTSTRRGQGVRLRWTHVDGGRGVQLHVDIHTEN